MPPHSLAEWIVGQNIPRKKKTTRKPVVKFEIDTDDERETDTLTVSYPRHGSTQRRKLSAKEVKSDKNAPPSSEEVNTSGSSPTDTDTSDEDQPKRRSSFKPGKSKSKMPIKANTPNAEQESAPEVIQVPADLNPHPTCTCLPCEAGRLVLKTLGRTPNGKTKHDGIPDVPVTPVDNKTKDKKPKGCGCNKASGSDTTAAPASGSQSEPEQPKAKGKQQAKKDQGKDHDAEKNAGDAKKADDAKKETPKQPQVAAPSAEPTTEAKPTPKALFEHQYRFAHVIEDPVKDPYPNAYFDRTSGVCHVYHGPSWGNPRGSPDPRRVMNQHTPPVGESSIPGPHHNYPRPNEYHHSFRNPLAQQEPIRYPVYAHAPPQQIVYAPPPPQQIIYAYPPHYAPNQSPRGYHPAYQNASPGQVTGYPPASQWVPAQPGDGYGVLPNLAPPQPPRSDPKPASKSPPKDNPAAGSKASSPPKAGSPAKSTSPKTSSPEKTSTSPKFTQENNNTVWDQGNQSTGDGWGGCDTNSTWGGCDTGSASVGGNGGTGTGGSNPHGDFDINSTVNNSGDSGPNNAIASVSGSLGDSAKETQAADNNVNGGTVPTPAW
ncbi:hypothetical protein B0T25DRAFT_155651 [Lasiosphaeria hispida]|uniref:Uncharacterized protein n=1 Tax=Lasiosphaeria hispida TaxID=260671 RepID=A0AAJ0MG39_9PEZI|nr:hypothetical protein B0T25DRAFT_155651 [Lasiosphaeria hispida]